MSLLAAQDVRRRLGERELLGGVSLDLAEGDRTGLVGANGSGKSTLLRILAGQEALDSGAVSLRRGARLGLLEQEPALPEGRSARDAVRAGLPERARALAELERVHARLAGAAQPAELEALLARQARLDERVQALGGHDVEHRVEALLARLGLRDPDAPCGRLSGGERRRVALARLLIDEPDLLLLDEPTNHLDAFTIDWLEDFLLETRAALLLVTHDRYVLDRVVARILELEHGRLHAYPGGYGEYLEQRAARLESERRGEVARLGLLRRETAWMRRGAPARTTKAKARIARFHAVAEAAPEPAARDLALAIPPGPRLGARVLALAGVELRAGGRTLVRGLDLELGPRERLGVVGPNGAGKTTLLEVLLGRRAPDAGAREAGETVALGAIDQLREDLDPRRTVAEEVAGRGDHVRVGERSVRVERFLDGFLFPGAAKHARVGDLSGGERSRVLLAKLLCAGANVLVLDEPTNDLDLATLRTLEEALLAFEGAVVVVSHDRWFLDRVAQRVLHLDGAGGWRLHAGDVSGLLERLAAERAAAPVEAPAKAQAARGEAPRADRPKRLAPWEERELDGLLETIGAAEAELAELDARLADPALYRGGREAAAALRAERERVAAEVAARYARWEELEERRA